nr:hypothetical protein [Tanacetum cinerariifolium]
MIGDFLQRKEIPLVLLREESPTIGLRCKSKYWLNVSRVTVCRGVATVRGIRSLRNCGAPALCPSVRIMLLAERLSSCSLRPCAD